MIVIGIAAFMAGSMGGLWLACLLRRNRPQLREGIPDGVPSPPKPAVVLPRWHAGATEIEAGVHEANARFQRAEDECDRLNQQLQHLRSISRFLGDTMDPSAIHRTVVQRTAELGYAFALILTAGDRRLGTPVYCGRAVEVADLDPGELIRASKGIPATQRHNLAVQSLVNRGLMVSDRLQDLLGAMLPPVLVGAIQQALGIRTVAALPLMIPGCSFGVLCVAHDRPSLSEEETEILRDIAGVASLALARAQYVNELKEKTRRLEEANRAAGEATQAKSRFLASMSHELRTPLNSILALTRVLLGKGPGAVEGDAKEHVKVVHRSGKNLLALINDILDLSRVEAGRLSLNPEHVDLRDLVQGVAAEVQALADSKCLALWTRAEESTPETAYQDPIRIRQILVNLVGNALKFTDQGAVGLRILSVNPDEVILEVADTGRGISEEEQKTIFDEFTRATSGDGIEGSGLGLAITGHLATFLGGRIELESALGTGSAFRVILPVDVRNCDTAELGAGCT